MTKEGGYKEGFFIDLRKALRHKGKMSDLTIIVLAAGRGVRMASSLPKHLHPVAGQPMLARVLKATREVHCDAVRVVVGYGENLITPIAGKFKALCFKQGEKDYGTAKALESARPSEITGDVLVVSGDHPLIHSSDLKNFIETCKKQQVDLGVGSFEHKSPSAFGRLVFKEENLVDIIEALQLKEGETYSSFVNVGLYYFKSGTLKHLKEIEANKTKEYPLTEIVSILNKKNYKVRAIPVAWNTAFGVNTQNELSVASSIMFENKCYELMSKGVIIVDPKHTYIESDVTVGSGSMIYPGVYLKGQVSIGHFCAIEPQSYIFDSKIDNYVNIKVGSCIEEAQVGERTVVGPYAHLRKGTDVGKECRIGNFVETKKAQIGDKSKAAHLSYLGDVEIGKDVNIGCGTVTCNYGVDKKKRKITIGDEVFIGSGVQLVAPVKIGMSAVVGAGSVITKDVPENSLALERTNQTTVKNYKKNK